MKLHRLKRTVAILACVFVLGGIAAMCLFCVVVGIFLTYVTVRTGSCLAAAIGHGAINGFVSAALLFSVTGGNPFVGPLPVGVVGGLHAARPASPREGGHARHAEGGPPRRRDEDRPGPRS